MTSAEVVIPNDKQRDELNNATGRRWLERHEMIDTQIAPFGRRAMEQMRFENAPVD
jgi:hypothetical protein